jgi:hypothetical protein
MDRRQITVLICVLLSFVTFSLSTSSQATAAAQEDILTALGTLKLADLKKAVPQGKETRITPEPGSRLDQVGAVTRFTEPGGGVAYYFNRAGILVSAQTRAKKPLAKKNFCGKSRD